MARAVVIGAGNISSHLLGHLARMLEVERIVIVDHDEYEPGNVLTQDIERSDVGQPKAIVQTKRLARIRNDLVVEPIVERVERVPLGRLRGDVLLAGLDNNRARQFVNEAAFRLGVPWIDAGIEASGLLARVNVYLPGRDRPCLECAWSERDYERLDIARPCRPEAGAPPTGAPSCLGGLAASLQALECRKLLAGERDRLADGRQVLLDAAHHTHYVTRLPRNPACRLDHEAWTIVSVPAGLDVEVPSVIDRAIDIANSHAVVLSVPGARIATGSVCRDCRREDATPRLERGLRLAGGRCPCGGERVARAVTESVSVAELGGRNVTPRSLGLRIGDSIRTKAPDGDVVHVEVDEITPRDRDATSHGGPKAGRRHASIEERS